MSAVNITIKTEQISLQAIHVMMGKLSLDDMNDLFENAITLLVWAIEEKEKGRIIGSTNQFSNHTFREVKTLALEKVPKIAQYA